MTREQFISIRNNALKNTLTGDNIVQVLYEYCQEKGMSTSQQNLIQDCISVLLKTGQWQHYFRIACEYYNVKFKVMELYSKSDLNLPQSGRILLKVY